MSVASQLSGEGRWALHDKMKGSCLSVMCRVEVRTKGWVERFNGYFWCSSLAPWLRSSNRSARLPVAHCERQSA